MSNLIPEGWSNPKLDEVVTNFQNGYAFSAKGYVPEGIPIISMGSIQLNGIFKKKNTKLKYWDAAAKEDLSRYLVKSEDLIMAMTDVTPTMELIGRACIVKGESEYFLNQRVGLISVDEEKVSKPFLSYLSNFDQWRSYCIGSSGLGAQANLGTSQILDGSILLPPLPEQQKIAAILSSVDEVIEKTQAQIEKLKDLKTGMMQELLSPREPKAGDQASAQASKTNGLHHTEFKDSPLGRIPVGWKVANIGALFTIQLGKMLSQASKVSETPYPYLGNKNVQWGKVDLNQLQTMDFSEKERSKFSLITGDLLICEGGEVGRSAIWNGEITECYYQKAIHRLRPINDSYDPNLLLEYIRYAKEQNLLTDFISQTSIAHLTKEKLTSIPVPVPSIEEQKEIVKVCLSANNRIDLCMQKLKKYHETKKALMQDLLTGKVRVSVN